MNNEEFIYRAKQIHGDKYNYDMVNYINANTKIKIICPIHGIFELRPANHLRGSGCRKCGYIKNSYTRSSNTDEFINKARKIHGTKYSYDKTVYINRNVKVCITCPIHGDFWQTPSNHLYGYQCKLCAIELTQKLNAYTKEEILNKITNIHHGQYTYGDFEYINKNTKIPIICLLHGISYVSVDSILYLKSGCPLCGINNSRHKQLLNKEDFFAQCNLKHNHYYLYNNDYDGMNNDILITCPKHGTFKQNARKHLNGGGCNLCEGKYHQLLILYNKLCQSFPDLDIVYEATSLIIPWIGLQRIDIYIPKYNIGIEYDGLQHFYPVTIFDGDEGLSKTKDRDQLKDKKCKDNNCTLYRIKYNYTDEDFNNLIINIKNIIQHET